MIHDTKTSKQNNDDWYSIDKNNRRCQRHISQIIEDHRNIIFIFQSTKHLNLTIFSLSLVCTDIDFHPLRSILSSRSMTSKYFLSKIDYLWTDRFLYYYDESTRLSESTHDSSYTSPTLRKTNHYLIDSMRIWKFSSLLRAWTVDQSSGSSRYILIFERK